MNSPSWSVRTSSPRTLKTLTEPLDPERAVKVTSVDGLKGFGRASSSTRWTFVAAVTGATPGGAWKSWSSSTISWSRAARSTVRDCAV